MQIDFCVSAKCNFALNIEGVYEDGYHRLDMCNASVGIWDEITLRISDGPSGSTHPVILCRMDGRAQDERNSAYRAAELYCKKFALPGAEIIIRKGIPFCAGLGGSSADAAGVLRALNDRLRLSSEEELSELALKCGADVPYMLYGGFARVRGKGELVERFSPKNHCALVILRSGSVLTAQAYALFDRNPNSDLQMSLEDVVRTVKDGKWGALIRCAGNALRPGAEQLCEGVSRNLRLLREFGAVYADMSGSGSAVFGIFESLGRAEAVARACRGRADYVCACMTLDEGYQLVHSSD